MKIAIGAIVFYLFGMVVFYTYSDFSEPLWAQIYHVWNKLKDTLLVLAIYGLLPKYRKGLMWAVMFSVARTGWEVWAWLMGLDINSRQAVNNLFLVLASVLLVLMLKDLKQWQRRKG